MLRGINVSGQKKIKMDELKSLYESLNFNNVQTYIQSGNVIFKSENTDSEKLEKLIGEKINQSFGYSVVVFVKTVNEIQQTINQNPFLNKSKEDITKLCVTFLSSIPDESLIKNLENFKSDSEDFNLIGNEIYLYYPDGYGRTKLSNNFFENKLKVSATTRNWRTVNKLFEIAK